MHVADVNFKVVEKGQKQRDISLEVLGRHHKVKFVLLNADRLFNWNSLLSYQKYRLKFPHRSDVLMQKINNNLRYLIQLLDARYNDLWLFPLPKEA